MGIFKDMWNDLQRVESEGFNPMNETYGQRMKAFVQQTKGGGSPGGPPMTVTQKYQFKQMLRDKYPDYVQKANSYYIGGEGGDYKLKPEMTELNMKNKEKINVDKNVWENINITDLKNGKEYATDLNPQTSELPEKYYKRGADVYDTLENTMSLRRNGGILDRKSPYVQRLVKAGRVKLEKFIEKELPEKELSRLGITRQQALNIVPSKTVLVK